MVTDSKIIVLEKLKPVYFTGFITLDMTKYRTSYFTLILLLMCLPFINFIAVHLIRQKLESENTTELRQKMSVGDIKCVNKLL